ncbi:hypothetical protein IKQ21_08600 [bacterium]|nr:hypothetical protein [bacterium]
MIKRLFAITIITFCIPVFAEETPATQNPLTVLQNINIEQCAKIYGISQDKLFNLTLASISANRFKVEEIQTAMGYIIFGVNRGKYIATIAKIDNSNSILRITPCNNVYNFPPGILTNTFKHIDINQKL